MTASEIFIQPENEEDEDTLGTEIENYLNCVLAKAGDFVKDRSLNGGSEVNNQNVTSQINSLLAQVDKAVSFVRNIMLSTERSLQHELEQVYESFLSVLRCMVVCSIKYCKIHVEFIKQQTSLEYQLNVQKKCNINIWTRKWLCVANY